MSEWRWINSTPPSLAVLVKVYCSSEDPFGTELQPIWDRYDHYEPLLMAGFKHDEIVRVREAFLTPWNLQGIIEPDAELDYRVDVWHASHDFVTETVRKMLGALLNRLPTVSGDDDYFDYYPDAFSIMDQIVFNVGQAMPTERAVLEAHLNLVRQIAVDLKYFEYGGWENINADMRYIEDRDRKIRHGWLALVQDEHGAMVWRYTRKYMADHNIGDMQLPDWVVR